MKIGDFGFTKRLKRSKETIKVGRITHPRWVAPEVRHAQGDHHECLWMQSMQAARECTPVLRTGLGHVGFVVLGVGAHVWCDGM